MALQHLRSSTANKRPTPAGMSDGQLALNTNDASPGLFFKDSNGALVKVGPVHVGTTAPNATPGSGGSSGNAIGEQWLDTTGGTYVFKVWDGSAWRSESGTFVDVNGDVMTGALGMIAGSAGSPGLYFSGDTNTGLYSPGADQVAISTGGSGRLFVDASGRVSVGLSNPARDFVVYRATAPSLHIQNSTSGTSDFDGLGVQLVGADASIVNYENGFLNFFTNSTERLRITSAGLVGVGTSSPGAALDVIGSTYIRGTSGGRKLEIGPSSAAFRIAADTISTGLELSSDFAGGYMDLQVAGSSRVYITNLGRVGVGTTSPLSRLHVEDSGEPVIYIRRDTTSATSLGGPIWRNNSFNVASIITQNVNANSADLTFSTSSGGSLSERLRIDSSGRVGIGVSSPGALLHIAEVAAGSGFSSTSLRSTRSNFGAEFTGYIDQGVSHGAIISTVSAGTATERIRITDAGRVGIGTTTVSNGVLHVKSSGISSQAGLAVEASANDSFLSITNNGSAHRLEASYNSTGSYQPISFVINGERARIDTSGRLLVGTSSVSIGTQLEVVNTTGSAAAFVVSAQSDFPVFCHNKATSGDNSLIRFGTEASFTGRGSVTYNRTGGVVAYNTTSDYRAKTILGDLENSGSTIDAFKVYRGVMNGATVERPMLIAHEAQEVAPYCVTGEKDAVDDDGNPIYQQMDHQVLVPLLIAEIQQLRARVAALESA